MTREISLGRGRVPRWKLERILIDALGDPFLEHDTAMAAIAAAFGSADRAERLWEWLDDAARPLFTIPDDLRQRAAALTHLMTNQLRLRAGNDDHRALLLDHLIQTRLGHPLLLASIGHELARRAGWPTVIATTHAQHVTVLTDDGYFAPIAYGIPLPAAHAAQLRACCPHGIAAATLAAISHHAPAEIAASATRIRDALLTAHEDHTYDT